MKGTWVCSLVGILVYFVHTTRVTSSAGLRDDRLHYKTEDYGHAGFDMHQDVLQKGSTYLKIAKTLKIYSQWTQMKVKLIYQKHVESLNVKLPPNVLGYLLAKAQERNHNISGLIRTSVQAGIVHYILPLSYLTRLQTILDMPLSNITLPELEHCSNFFDDDILFYFYDRNERLMNLSRRYNIRSLTQLLGIDSRYLFSLTPDRITWLIKELPRFAVRNMTMQHILQAMNETGKPVDLQYYTLEDIAHTFLHLSREELLDYLHSESDHLMDQVIRSKLGTICRGYNIPCERLRKMTILELALLMVYMIP